MFGVEGKGIDYGKQGFDYKYDGLTYTKKYQSYFMIRKPVIQRQKPMNQKTNDSDKSETKACLRSWDNKSF